MKYLLVYHNLQGSYSDESIHNFITGLSCVDGWWHYLPNAYILNVTSGSSKVVADALITKFSGLLFFVSKVDLTDVNGLLAKGAWDWINKQNVIKIKPVLRVTSPPPSNEKPQIKAL